MDIRDLKKNLTAIDTAIAEAQDTYDALVQKLSNKYNIRLATGHMSDTWQMFDKKKGCFMSLWDYGDTGQRIPKILQELGELDKLVQDYRIGATNGERIDPDYRRDKI